MFGLTDRFFVLFRSFFPWNSKGTNFIKKRIEINSKEVWLCFLPFFSFNIFFLRKRLIPKNVSSIIYVFPKVPVFSNPWKTKKFLDKVYTDVSKEIIRLNKRGRKVNLLFHSLSNVLMARFARRFEINKLIAISPGANLAECIWESIATAHVKKEAIDNGLKLDDFRKALRNYNPIDAVDKINGSVTIYLGRHDKIIPYQQGVKFARAFRRKNRTVKVYDYSFFGHTTTVWAFKHE